MHGIGTIVSIHSGFRLLGAQDDGWIDPHRPPSRDRGGEEGNDKQSRANHCHSSESG
jgi:hypothetical protein